MKNTTFVCCRCEGEFSLSALSVSHNEADDFDHCCECYEAMLEDDVVEDDGPPSGAYINGRLRGGCGAYYPPHD